MNSESRYAPGADKWLVLPPMKEVRGQRESECMFPTQAYLHVTHDVPLAQLAERML